MNISVDVSIESSVENVWQKITDIESCTQMITGIIDLTVLSKPEDGLVGLKWRETREIFGKQSSETMWITDCKKNEYYTTRAENHGAIYITTMSVTQIGSKDDNKTKLTMSFSGTSDSLFIRLISSLMGVFIKKSMIKMIEQDLNDIKAFVEKRY